MSAFYLVDVTTQCCGPAGMGCGKTAVCELRGPRNEGYGHYCRTCGETKARQMNRDRERETEATR